MRTRTFQPYNQRFSFNFRGYSGEACIVLLGDDTILASEASLDVDGKTITIRQDTYYTDGQCSRETYAWVGEPDPLALAKLRLLI